LSSDRKGMKRIVSSIYSSTPSDTSPYASCSAKRPYDVVDVKQPLPPPRRDFSTLSWKKNNCGDNEESRYKYQQAPNEFTSKDPMVLKETPPHLLEEFILEDNDRNIEYKNFTINQIYERSKPLSFLIYKTLNESQRTAFHKLNNYIANNDNGIIIIDAPPGVGKSFLVKSWGCIHKRSPFCMVYKNELAKDLSNFGSINAKSTCSFIMKSWKVKYKDAIVLFDETKEDECKDCYELSAICRNCDFKIFHKLLRYITTVRLGMGIMGEVNEKILIMDEYTTASPWLIAILIFISQCCNVFIIFVGDKNQLGLSKSAHHRGRSNWSVIEPFVKDAGKIELMKQVRIKDATHLNLINVIKRNIISDRDDTPNTFAAMYFLFESLGKRVFESEPIDSVMYIAERHIDLKARMLYNISKKKSGVLKQRFKFLLDDGTLVFDNEGLNDNQTPRGKFLPYFLLVVGWLYKIMDRSSDHYTKVGVLLRLPTDEIDSMDLKLIHSGEVIRLPYRPLYKSSCCMGTLYDDHYKDLIKKIECEYEDRSVEEIYNWPIRYYNYYTFCSVQGHTINKSINMEINLTTKCLNSIYVALSRVVVGDQIKRCKIAGNLLKSFIFTKNINDDYYYKLALPGNAQNNPLTQKSFTIVDNVYSFEESTIEVRILKSAYDSVFWAGEKTEKVVSTTKDSRIIMATKFCRNNLSLADLTDRDFNIDELYKIFIQERERDELIQEMKKTDAVII